MTLQRLTRWTVIPALFATCIFLNNGQLTAKDDLPPGQSDKLIEADIAFLQKGLAKTPEKRAVPTLKATAMMIALYAQNNLDGKDAAKYAGIRDQALKVAAAIAKNDIPGAKAAADGIATAKGTDTKPMKLHDMHGYDLAELMSQFRATRVGGRNLEADLKEQAKKVTDPKLVGEIGARLSAIGIYTVDLPATKAVGAKKKEWDKLSLEMKKLGEELATEAAKPKPDLTLLAKKVAAVNANCVACHADFR